MLMNESRPDGALEPPVWTEFSRGGGGKCAVMAQGGRGGRGGEGPPATPIRAGEPSRWWAPRSYSPFSGSSGRIITPSNLAPVSGWVSPLPVRGASTSSGAQSYGLGSGTVTLL